MLLTRYPDHEADARIKELDASGMSLAVLLGADFSPVAATELPCPEPVERHFNICRRHPGRFVVHFGADPRTGADGAEAFETALDDYGFADIELYTTTGYSPGDRASYPYHERCAKHAPSAQ